MGCVCLLQWEDALNHFKSELASGRDVFGPLIHKYLLDNKHRSVPDSLKLPYEGAGVKKGRQACSML